VSDPVSRVIAQRQVLEAGFPRSVFLSVAGHAVVLGVAVAGPLLLPKEPLLKVAPGFLVALPRGGGGSPDAQAPAPAARPEPPRPVPTAAPEPESKPEPPKILKPPKEEKRRGVPAPDSRKVRTKPEPAPPPTGGMPGGTGTSPQVLGIGVGPPGAGVPDGTAAGGDWYLATVQQKIWMLWNRELGAGPKVPVRVTFTILADGRVEDVRVVESSGVYLVDQAAQRAVVSAAPFGPLPKNYETNRYTIHALFKSSQ
jgi:periplasmic protein TonB